MAANKTVKKGSFEKTYFDHVVKSGVDGIQTVLDSLKRAVEQVESYARTYDEVAKENGSSHSRPEDVLSWVVNHMASNVLGNCRLDILVSKAAEIAKARAYLNAETR